MKDHPEMTNADLARACNVGRASVTKWLSGETGIDVEHIPIICRHFGVSISELFGEFGGDVLSARERQLLDSYNRADAKGKELLDHVASFVSLSTDA